MFNPTSGVPEVGPQHGSPVPEPPWPLRVVVNDANELAVAFAAPGDFKVGPDVRHRQAGKRYTLLQWQLVRRETALLSHQLVQINDRGPRPLELPQTTPSLDRNRSRWHAGSGQPRTDSRTAEHCFSIARAIKRCERPGHLPGKVHLPAGAELCR